MERLYILLRIFKEKKKKRALEEFSCGATDKDPALSLQKLGSAAAQVQSLSWEHAHATGMAKSNKHKKKTQNTQQGAPTVAQ